MATYTFDGNKWYWNEQHASTSLSNRLYGAERLGVIAIPEGIPCVDESTTTTEGNVDVFGYEVNDGRPNTSPGHHYQQFAGSRRYEITNHLGNVMVVINDLPIIDQSEGFQLADVVTATDYIPACAERSRSVGLEMPLRTYSASDYSFAFNGKINDEEILPNGRWQDFGFRAYRPDLGRWITVDPLSRRYSELSSYSYVGNSPLSRIDPDGRYIEFLALDQNTASILANEIARSLGGNVSVTFNDRKLVITQVSSFNNISQQVLFSQLTFMINSPEGITMRVSNLDDNTPVDNYDAKLLDPSDLACFPTVGSTRTIGGMISHIFNEQWHKQVIQNCRELETETNPSEISNFYAAHKYATTKEFEVTGVITTDIGNDVVNTGTNTGASDYASYDLDGNLISTFRLGKPGNSRPAVFLNPSTARSISFQLNDIKPRQREMVQEIIKENIAK